jgi:branched-chain amino acid transport system substrate-binding protein
MKGGSFMKKFYSLAIFVSLFLLAFSLQTGQSFAADPIYVGLMAPMTGDYAEYGMFFKQGMEVAIDQINKAGGIKGRMIEIVVGDSRADPKEAALVAQKFTANPKIVAVVGDFTSSCAMAAAPIYESAQMVQVSPSSSHPDFTRLGKFMFRNTPTQEYEAPFLAKWAVRDLGKKKVATIYIKNDWGISTNKYFVETAKSLGAEVVAQEEFLPGEKDFTAILTKIKNTNPELLYLGAMYAETALITQQMQKMRFKPIMMGCTAIFSPKLIELAGDAVEGILANALYFPDFDRPEVKNFTKAFVEKNKKEPNNFAALAYDSMNILIYAMKTSDLDKVKMRDAIASLKNFPGATGGATFVGGDVVKEYGKIMVKNGKWAAYKP